MFLKFLCEFIEFFFTDVNYFHRMCFAIFSSFFKVFFISIVCVSIPHNSTISKSRYVFVGLKMNICNNLLSVNTHGFQQRRFSMTFYTSIQLWHMIPSHLNFFNRWSSCLISNISGYADWLRMISSKKINNVVTVKFIPNRATEIKMIYIQKTQWNQFS